MSAPEVSILMPVFNEEKYLHSCLDSIINQEYDNWELLAVDDFSTDESFSILCQFASQDARIKVYRNEEKGIIPGLKLAFEQSSGILITRMDADDLMPLPKLSSLRRALLTSGNGCVVSGKVKYFSDGVLAEGFFNYGHWLNTIVDDQSHWSNIYKECVIPSACWMAYKTDLLEIHAFQKSRYPEDYDLAFRFYQAGFRVHGVNEVLHTWRDHPARASRVDPNYADQNFFGLKVHYFKTIDFGKERALFLWGAGKKGKQLAQELIKVELPFRWVTKNTKKIGKDIYDIELEDMTMLEEPVDKQIIVAISSKDFQDNKQQIIDEIGYEGNRYFFFC